MMEAAYLRVWMLTAFITASSAFLENKLFGSLEPVGVFGEEDPGEPLYLTPLIKAGKLDEARNRSKVGPLPPLDITSYSGYLTVNETCNSNTFFWFFPARNNDTGAPVLLWLQGGAGATSMFGLFVENGPFYLDANLTLHERLYTWNRKYSVVYIDNPIGAGFSFTEVDECYVRNEDDIARDLYSALVQFFTLFSHYQSNDFYATGESYAGKYLPAISLKIHEENAHLSAMRINLKGMIIGDGFCDPEGMLPELSTYLYNIGLLDRNQQQYFAKQIDIVVNYFKTKKYSQAFGLYDDLINGDLIDYKTWFYNQTGLDFYYNYLLPVQPKDFDYFNKFMPQDWVRKSIHVGNKTFNDGKKVEKRLIGDFFDTVKPRVVRLLDANYKVLMYSGMLDIVVPLPLTEAFLDSLPWSGLDGYRNAPRKIWKLRETDVDIAGYVRVYKNLVQMGIRGAGHILPYDQPERAWQMIDMFISQFNP